MELIKQRFKQTKQAFYFQSSTLAKRLDLTTNYNLQQHPKIQTSIHYIHSPRKMKTFSITTICLTTAFASSVSANNQCLNNLPPTTAAHPRAQNWEFSRADSGWVGGPIPSTKCSGRKTNEYTNISSANQCASTCSNAAVNSASRVGPSLLGYNYNCRTKKCDCILGRKSDNISSTVKKTFSGNWACYEANSFSPPKPTPPTPTPPTPAQCTLPATVRGSAFGKSYTFEREQPQYQSTTCYVGTGFLPFQADNIQDCADQCAGRSLPGGSPGSKQMVGFDYSCDTNKCTCLTASGGTNLQDTVQLTNENMACYFVTAIGVGEGAYAQMDTKKYLRANVVQTWD